MQHNSSEIVTPTAIENLETLVQELQDAKGATHSATVDATPVGTKPRGFQHRSTARTPWPPAELQGAGLAPPKPLPKRPTGRFFVGSILAAICLTIGWLIWDTFLGVAAYGIVKGDTIGICVPFDGEVAVLHVSEGQSINRGNKVLTLRSSELERQLGRLNDELVIEQAKLGADSAKQLWESQAHAAQYFETFGVLQQHREELARLQSDVDRMDQLKDPTIIPLQEQDRMRFALLGQRELVAKLASALEELRKRTEAEGEPDPLNGSVQLKPTLARVTFLESEICRLGAQILEGEVCSPVNGVVVKRHAAVGQRVAQMTTVFDIVDRDSLAVELFVPQDDANSISNGQPLSVSIESMAGSVKCVVETGRECFEPAPAAIRRYYKSDEPLLPVVLRPQSASNEQHLRIGAVTRLTLLQSYGWQ